MTTFWNEFDARVAQYDLLKHPYYQAWTNGDLTREDLKEYAAQYYSHVAAFPDYLEALEKRLPTGELRDAIRLNREDEMGSIAGVVHSDLWLDFANGMGASTQEVLKAKLFPQVSDLVESFHKVANKGEVVEALAMFCAYESQIPQVSKQKVSGLKDFYGADEATYKYFLIHTIADIEHTAVWHRLIDKEIKGDPGKAELALNSAEKTAKKLWEALDGIEEQRLARRTPVPA